MVAVRVFAEVTMLCILIGLPIFLWFHGDLIKLSVITRSLFVVAGVVALLVLPAYGFITYRVAIDIDGLRTFALFRKHFMPWERVAGLRLRAAFGWRRYVVISDSDEISFPVWLNKIEELVEQIRARLPQGGRLVAVAGQKVFAQDRIGTAFQMFKLAAGIAFILLFWMFYAYMQWHKPVSGRPQDPADAMFILVTCLVFTAAMIFRSVTIVMMPRVVSTDQEGVSVQTWFKRTSFAWQDLKSVSQPLFFLPEGIVVKATNGKYLIGNELDAFDELEEELRSHLPRPEATFKT